MEQFKLVSEYAPAGDQPKAIAELVEGVRQQHALQTLLGVTGSGKTFTMANVVKELQMPALVVSHNKTLAAQLYGEFKGYFPTMRSSISSATTTTISPKPTSRVRTRTSRRRSSATRRSIACGSRPSARCCSAAM